MQAQLAKWGNSLALRIPKALAQQVRWQEGERLELSVNEGGEVVLRPARPGYRLEDLVGGITPENRQPENDWGHSRGGEAW